MNDISRTSPAGAYQVGYGKPPVHTRFRKGQSGNPGGRPRGITAGRAAALALKEAYRPVNVKAGDRIMVLRRFRRSCAVRLRWLPKATVPLSARS